MRLRTQTPNVPITEAHPKALFLAFRLAAAPWRSIADKFGLKGSEPENEHRRDAILCAVAAREGARKTWRDLSNDRNPEELNPKRLWFGR
jgi:hypothetical protein